MGLKPRVHLYGERTRENYCMGAILYDIFNQDISEIVTLPSYLMFLCV